MRHPHFAGFDERTRMVQVASVSGVLVTCLPVEDKVSILTTANNSCICMTIAAWNYFARDEYRIPTYDEWKEFLSSQNQKPE